MYYTYIIESIKNHRWYIGHSMNPCNRLRQHNAGYTKSTKSKGPWKLIFLRKFNDKIDANRFE